jgi:predicted nucleotidyltransferase
VRDSKILLESSSVENTVVSPCKKSGAKWETARQAPNGDFGAILRVGVCGQKVLYTYLMTKKSPIDPILKRFRAALDEIYGNRLDRVVLFGSHARGEARPDSDYDIAVFLKDPDSFWKESGRLAEIETDILYDTGAVINALPFPAGAYREQTALMHEVRREGLDL